MADWIDYKGEGPWDFSPQPDKVRYNEGALIATSDDPTWEYPNQLGGAPVTLTHHPGCGYWHKHKVDFITNTGFYIEFDAPYITITLTDPDFSGPYTWNSGDGDFASSTTSTGVNILDVDVCSGDDMLFNVTNNLGETISYNISAASIALAWDGSQPSTISQSEDIVLTIENGLGPFTWAVIGTGASFATPVTTIHTNVLSATSGSCGLFEVTVTDSCGTVIDLYVLNTNGDYTDYCYESGDPYPGWTYRDADACTYEWTGGTVYANGWKNQLFNCVYPQDKSVGPVALYCAAEYITSYYRCEEAPCSPVAFKSYKWSC